ncbi:CsbD family protein [Domibacillus iocasae]|uniref:CsbD family protein n=1 Tax=Domibacillus iocasae TaxID=1714016 RepID=A0A1E7DUA4_9BACI|nr:CsbD family protein [Domibacillus iocasae]OES46634.1 CsbD family protein [Domibacillus iocasae]
MAHDNNGLGDKLKAGVNKAKGEVKDQIGNATNNTRMQADGKKDKVKGEVQERIGESKERH